MNTLIKVRIKNLRYNQPTELYDVKVDRTSVLGNPFRMGLDISRHTVCDQYGCWLASKILHDDSIIINELRRLRTIALHHGKLNLFCWCAPEECHAESIHNILLYSEEFPWEK